MPGGPAGSRAADDTTAYDPSVDYPQDPAPVIAPGTRGEVTFGVRNTTGTSGVSDGEKPWAGGPGQMMFGLYAPRGAVFPQDAKVTPVGNAIAWSCTRQAENYLWCTSDYKGEVVPPGTTMQWKVDVEVPYYEPYNETLTSTDSFFIYWGDCKEWFSPYMTVRVNTGPAPV